MRMYMKAYVYVYIMCIYIYMYILYAYGLGHTKFSQRQVLHNGGKRNQHEREEECGRQNIQSYRFEVQLINSLVSCMAHFLIF
jgi:hypothetical protein